MLLILPGFHPEGEGARWYDRRFWPTVGNTLVFVAFAVPAVTITALVLAAALVRETKAMSVLRTLSFQPNEVLARTTSSTALGLLPIPFTAQNYLDLFTFRRCIPDKSVKLIKKKGSDRPHVLDITCPNAANTQRCEGLRSLRVRLVFWACRTKTSMMRVT